MRLFIATTHSFRRPSAQSTEQIESSNLDDQTKFVDISEHNSNLVTEQIQFCRGWFSNGDLRNARHQHLEARGQLLHLPADRPGVQLQARRGSP